MDIVAIIMLAIFDLTIIGTINLKHAVVSQSFSAHTCIPFINNNVHLGIEDHC